MQDFAAIDFETANARRSSVCAVGVVVVRAGAIADSFYSLIHPVPNYYAPFCQRVHGISKRDTDPAPYFPDVWEKVAPLIDGLPLVAHNKAFDQGCLRSVFAAFDMDYPEYEFYCTLTASRRALPYLRDHRLPTVSRECGYDLLTHHHALADAEACAAIALRLL